jgi:hypothetical protein
VRNAGYRSSSLISVILAQAGIHAELAAPIRMLSMGPRMREDDGFWVGGEDDGSCFDGWHDRVRASSPFIVVPAQAGTHTTREQ